jgi:hypothetical protein
MSASKLSRREERYIRSYRANDEQGKRRLEHLMRAFAMEQDKPDQPLHEAISALEAIRTSMSRTQYLLRVDEALDRFAPQRN